LAVGARAALVMNRWGPAGTDWWSGTLAIQRTGLNLAVRQAWQSCIQAWTRQSGRPGNLASKLEPGKSGRPGNLASKLEPGNRAGLAIRPPVKCGPSGPQWSLWDRTWM